MDEYKVQIIDLLLQLSIRRDILNHKAQTNNDYKEVAKSVDKLCQTLHKCHDICKQAIENAHENSKHHRGWYKVDLIVRRIVGVLATIAVIPAIAVAISSKGGYAKTFFTKEKPETRTANKITEFKQKFEDHKKQFIEKDNALSQAIKYSM